MLFDLLADEGLLPWHFELYCVFVLFWRISPEVRFEINFIFVFWHFDVIFVNFGMRGICNNLM